MKQSLLRGLLVFSLSIAVAAAEWGDSYWTRMDQIRRDPIKEQVMAIADDIAADYRYSVYRTPSELLLLNKIRDELCQIPGHAQYFADLIEEERKLVAHLPANTGERVTYDSNRFRYFEVLEHLPSPETVKVLGTFLADERDFFAMRPIPGYPGQTYSGCPGNMTLAMFAFRDLGLREAPPMDVNSGDAERVRLWRKWYEEIKSGERAFSFKGQSVEYRFKPDGTWVSTPIANPPDDAPPLPPAKSAQPAPGQPPGTPPSAATPAPVSGPVWPWITGGILTVLAALAYFLKFRRPSVGRPV